MSALLERALPAGTDVRVLERLFPTAHPYAADPVGYCRDVLRFEPWSKQREILEAVRDHERVAVKAGRGSGKTAVAARIALWFLATHPGDTRVITTGVSWDGVKNLLWKEIGEAWRASNGQIGGKLTATELDLGDKRFAVGLSTNDPIRFQGHHADHLLLIVDEASGLDERIFGAAEGYFTGLLPRLLMIGNPTDLAGEFHAAFHSKRAHYRTISISSFDTPGYHPEEQVSPDALTSFQRIPEWVEDMRSLYGETSPLWDVQVLGEFPSTADDTVCSLAAVQAARARESTPDDRVQPVVIACDVARFGSDETVITVRQGSRVRIVRHYVGQDTMRTVGEIMAVARQVEAGKCVEAPGLTEPPTLMRLVVDDVGVGGGVTDRLREIGRYQVVPFNGGNESWSDDYPNRRSELWHSFSERLGEIDLDDDEQLAADLVAPRYKLDSRSRRVVEPKADTKKRLSRSPDRADAVLLAFAVPDARPRPAVAQRPENQPITAGLMERKW